MISLSRIDNRYLCIYVFSNTLVLEKTLESPLDCKEIQPVHSKGDQPWDFFGRNDAKAETPILWPPDAKSWLIGKDSDAGRDWGQEEKGTAEDEMAGWHHRLDGREFEWTPGVGDGQGGLACCDSWGRKESDRTEWLIWSDLIYVFSYEIRLNCALGTRRGTNNGLHLSNREHHKLIWCLYKMMSPLGQQKINCSQRHLNILNHILLS